MIHFEAKVNVAGGLYTHTQRALHKRTLWQQFSCWWFFLEKKKQMDCFMVFMVWFLLLSISIERMDEVHAFVNVKSVHTQSRKRPSDKGCWNKTVICNNIITTMMNWQKRKSVSKLTFTFSLFRFHFPSTMFCANSSCNKSSQYCHSYEYVIVYYLLVSSIYCVHFHWTRRQKQNENNSNHKINLNNPINRCRCNNGL